MNVGRGVGHRNAHTVSQKVRRSHLVDKLLVCLPPSLFGKTFGLHEQVAGLPCRMRVNGVVPRDCGRMCLRLRIKLACHQQSRHRSYDSFIHCLVWFFTLT